MLFVAQRAKGQPLTHRGTRGNLGETIYRRSPTLFQTVPSPTPTVSSSPRLGVHNSRPKTQNCNRYYLRNGLGYGLHICQEHSYGLSEQKPVKSLEESERGRIQGLQNFVGYYLRDGRSYLSNGPQVWQVHSQGPSEQKPIKNLVKGRISISTIQGCPILGYRQLFQERVKLRSSNSFCTHILSINQKKSPLEISEK